MKITATMNCFGHIHVWEGVEDVPVNKTNPACHKLAGRESNAYLQSFEDVEFFLGQLPKEKRLEIEDGFTIEADVHDDYACAILEIEY